MVCEVTIHYKLFYEAGRPSEVYGYTYVDWAGSISKRSTSGFMFSCGSGAISWSNKKYPISALSSIEAKYRGAIMAAYEVAWLRKLLDDMGQSMEESIVIYCENISSIMLANSPI